MHNYFYRQKTTGANQLALFGLKQSRFQLRFLFSKNSTQIEESLFRSASKCCNCRRFKHEMRILQKFAIFKRSWLTFCNVANKVVRALRLCGDRFPLDAGWICCAAT